MYTIWQIAPQTTAALKAWEREKSGISTVEDRSKSDSGQKSCLGSTGLVSELWERFLKPSKQHLHNNRINQVTEVSVLRLHSSLFLKLNIHVYMCISDQWFCYTSKSLLFHNKQSKVSAVMYIQERTVSNQKYF